MIRRLGPRNLGDIIGDTFKIYKERFLSVLAIAAIGTVAMWIILLIGILLTAVVVFTMVIPGFFDVLTSAFSDPNAEAQIERAFTDITESWDGPPWVGLFITAILLLATILAATAMNILMSGAIIHATAEWELGMQPRIVASYIFALNRLPAIIGTAILIGLAMLAIGVAAVGLSFAVDKIDLGWLIAVIVVATISGSVYIVINWSVALQSVIFERQNPTGALARSYYLVSENWWRILGIMIVSVLILIGLQIVIFIVSLIPILGLIVNLIWSMLTGVVWAIITTFIYFDLRSQKEYPDEYSTDDLALELGYQINTEQP